jgi:hypothetical protein
LGEETAGAEGEARLQKELPLEAGEAALGDIPAPGGMGAIGIVMVKIVMEEGAAVVPEAREPVPLAEAVVVSVYMV